MKKTVTAVCLLVLTVALLLGGCAPVLEQAENTELRQQTESMLNALLADDIQAGYALVREVCTEEEFRSIFSQMQALIGDVDTYTLTLLSVYTNIGIADGQKVRVTNAAYQMTTPQSNIVVSVRSDSRIGMSSFYLTPYEKTDYVAVGTLKQMQGATAAQWILLLSNLLALGFTGFMLVDCCRRKLPKKVFWILLILIGFLSLGVTVSDAGFQLNFNLGWIMAYSALIRYGSGRWVFRLMLPVGAFSYWIARRSSLKNTADTASSGDTAPDTAADTPAQADPDTQAGS